MNYRKPPLWRRFFELTQETVVGVGFICNFIALSAALHGDWIAMLSLLCFGIAFILVASAFDA